MNQNTLNELATALSIAHEALGSALGHLAHPPEAIDDSGYYKMNEDAWKVILDFWNAHPFMPYRLACEQLPEPYNDGCINASSYAKVIKGQYTNEKGDFWPFTNRRMTEAQREGIKGYHDKWPEMGLNDFVSVLPTWCRFSERMVAVVREERKAEQAMARQEGDI